MKILHICTGNPFTPTMYYKENYLIDANLEDGHDVTVLADTTTWDGDGHIVDVAPGETTLDNGVKLIRLPYAPSISKVWSRKIRKFERFLETVLAEKPDVILFHAIQQYGITQLKTIRKHLPDCKVYGDVSTSFENSAQNVISKRVLHGMIYRHWMQKSLSCWTKIFYVTEASRDFLKEMYDVPENMLELNALPARVMPREEKLQNREIFRKQHGVASNTLVFFHSGKIDKKKKTVELLQTLQQMSGQMDYQLFIAGSFADDVREDLDRLIAEMPCVTHLGFLNQAEMQTALAACDLYLQPGGASQTAQAATCCGTPIVVSGEKEYRLFMDRNGYLIQDLAEVVDIFAEIAGQPEKLAKMSEYAYQVAHRFFNFRTLAARLYQ